MSKSNFPNSQIDNLPAEFVADAIESIQALASSNKITRDASMDQEFEDRVNMIIEFCKRKKMRLGIETLCAGLGISRQELHNWENGVGNTSERRKDGVKQIKQLIYAFLEQCGMSGRLNPTTYVWLSKNWMNYVDEVKIDTGGMNIKSDPALSQEEIHQIADQARQESIRDIICELPD